MPKAKLLIPRDAIINGFCYSFAEALLKKLEHLVKVGGAFKEGKGSDDTTELNRHRVCGSPMLDRSDPKFGFGMHAYEAKETRPVHRDCQRIHGDMRSRKQLIALNGSNNAKRRPASASRRSFFTFNFYFLPLTNFWFSFIFGKTFGDPEGTPKIIFPSFSSIIILLPSAISLVTIFIDKGSKINF